MANTLKKHLLLILFFPALLLADLDSFFNEDQDPTLFHHVNVITGNLNLCMQDSQVQGPRPLPIQRTYTSAGALENISMSDLTKGWSLFPHTKLRIESSDSDSGFKIYHTQKSGSVIQYEDTHRKKRKKGGTLFFKAKCDLFQCSGKISARTNPSNNKIRLDARHGELQLLFPDGGYWIFKGEKIKHHDQKQYTYFLEKEVLPSKEIIRYTYNKENHLKTISLRSPREGVYSYINISNERKSPYAFNLTTSDGQTLHYQAREFKEQSYLYNVSGKFLPQEIIHYENLGDRKRARVTRIEREGQILFDVTYNPIEYQAHSKKRKNEEKKKTLQSDRVHILKAPLGLEDKLEPIATFTYSSSCTDVRDVHNILTRYHHDTNRLKEIEYYDENDHPTSVIKFIWQGAYLKGKVKLDANRSPLFSKTFKHDALGNVTEETFWGNLTGNAPGPYTLNADGSLSGAESYYKRYEYHPEFNVPLLEEEEGGLSYHYTYKAETDLLSSKLTYHNTRLLKRELRQYDPNHLLIAQIIDDGTDDQRYIERYTYDLNTGLIKTKAERYLDPETKQEVPLKTTTYKYNENRRLYSQTVFDATHQESYTLYTKYDKHGNIASQTNPLGQESTYSYDKLGKLESSSEVGSPTKTFTYDILGNPLTCTETDPFGNKKTTYTTYDAKGRLLSQTDAKGNQTHQVFNTFGQCLETHLPQIKDQDGRPYIPIIQFTYDANGNIATTTTPRGDTTHTTYNTLRKPLTITHPDGTQIHHTYNKDGTQATTTYPDNTTVHYTYDPFQRKTSEQTFSADGTLLKQENWEYSTFNLRSYTNPLGLTTHTTYDGAGRKIQEKALDREVTYTYDALGFQETTTTPQLTHIEHHDPLGRVTEQWDQTPDGSIENHMTFTYDSNNRKQKASRQPSQGPAIDTFTHDIQGRLLTHTDPLKATTTIHYNEKHLNDLNQHVLQKITTDPKGNRTLETYDALNHLLTTEKQSPSKQTVAKDTYTYDRSGNQIQRSSTIYHDTAPQNTIHVTWTYDAMGRVTSETEGDEKTTHYTYDSRGRISQKILPNTTTIDYTYDGIGRPLIQSSSDGTINYQYTDYQGDNPTHIYDAINDHHLIRTYNPFGELIQETNPHHLQTTWTYDNAGRCTHLALPSDTHITYTYNGPHLTTATLSTPTHTCTHTYTHFDENGHVAEEELIHHLGTLTTTHDLLERPTTQTSPYHTHTTTYGPSGLITYTQNTLQGDKEYTYDSLNQLLSAGTDTYHFDSLGNPTHSEINTCNQLLSTPDTTLTYDPCGNPQTRTTPTIETTYTYDALGRLLTLTEPAHHITFTYDALSRLISTTQNTQTEYYLYDQDHDIGTLTQEHTLKNLKLLGLGLKGDIGATVAILTNNTLYAPLHDTQGNIIALIAPDQTIAETYHFDPFGKEAPTPTINPWRYSSKRSLHHLIYFGLRFYDPTLSRWLTPDPSGFTDSPNLYLYVLNSPLNRLDLFGLTSTPASAADVKFIFPVVHFPEISQLLIGKAHSSISSTDIVASCGHFHLLRYSVEELAAGKFDLSNHLAELTPKEGSIIGLVTFENGIMTNLEGLKANSQSIINQIPEGTLFIGLHNPTEGIQKDLARTSQEINHIENISVAHDRQVLIALSTNLYNINPQALWLYIDHSEGGVRYNRVYEGMTPFQQQQLQEQLLLRAFGPAEPTPTNYARSAVSFYSKKDRVTLPLAKSFLNDTNYDIKVLPCTSPRSTWTLLLADHPFLAPTYQGALKGNIQLLREDEGFYNGKVR